MGLLALCLCASVIGALPEAEEAAPGVPTERVARSGLHKLGLGLEGPMVGVSMHVVGDRVTFGYAAGGSLSWEMTPRLLLRAYTSASRTYGEQALIAYRDTAIASASLESVARRRQEARWFGFELGFGAAYLWREPSSSVVPFIGLDGALAYAGYEYVFPSSDPLTSQESTENTLFGSINGQDSFAWGFLGTLRAGTRLCMRSWLATQAELGLSYWPGAATPIRNTYTALNVRAVSEPSWIIRATFSARLGL